MTLKNPTERPESTWRVYRSPMMGGWAEITAEHAASSHGQPVLVCDGNAFGPADVMPSGLTAGALVQMWVDGADPGPGTWGAVTTEGERAARAFLGTLAAGPLAALLGWYDVRQVGDLSQFWEPWERILFAALDHCGHAADEDGAELAELDRREHGGDLSRVVRLAVTDGVDVAGVHRAIAELLRDLATRVPEILEAAIAKPFLAPPGTQAAPPNMCDCGHNVWRHHGGEGPCRECNCQAFAPVTAPGTQAANGQCAHPGALGACVPRISDGRCIWCERELPRTQAAAVAAICPEALALGKQGPGGLYKPDASPTAKRCARCGAEAMWIAGAGEALCVRHQDDY